VTASRSGSKRPSERLQRDSLKMRRRPVLEWTLLGAILGSGLAFGDRFDWIGLFVGVALGGTIGAIIGVSAGLLRRRRGA